MSAQIINFFDFLHYRDAPVQRREKDGDENEPPTQIIILPVIRIERAPTLPNPAAKRPPA